MRLKNRLFLLVTLSVTSLLASCSTLSKSSKSESSISGHIPKVTDPNISRVWIPDRVEGNRFEEGHWLYVIEKPVSFKKE
jgi:hypothetical protein